MSVIIKKTSTLSFSSNSSFGATNVRNNGSTFDVTLHNPIKIPANGVDCDLFLTQASIWNTSPNISAAYGNNKFYVIKDNNLYTFTIPDGLYSLTDLSTTLSRLFVNSNLPTNTVVLSGDSSTQKTVLTYPLSGVQVDFTKSNSVKDILGFNSRLSPANISTAGKSDNSDNIAKFNRINSYYIRSSMLENGLSINNYGSGLIGNVLITSQPGSQINYQPYHPIGINCENIIGKSVRNITFDLLDDSFRNVDTNGEIWSFTISIVYKILQ